MRSSTRYATVLAAIALAGCTAEHAPSSEHDPILDARRALADPSRHALRVGMKVDDAAMRIRANAMKDPSSMMSGSHMMY